MKLLITNDDGVDALGIEALASAAREFGEAIVIAPETALSGCSHRVTTDRPFSVRRAADGCYAIAGTPADCVRVGIFRLAPDTDWVLSGVNQGSNLGTDVYHSGTVAAVREAALHGIPAIAVSHYRKKTMEIDWQRAVDWIVLLLEDIMSRPHTPRTFWNINLPHLESEAAKPDPVFCPLDPSPLPLSYCEDANGLRYNSDYHLRERARGCDVDVCFGGRIAVTQLRV